MEEKICGKDKFPAWSGGEKVLDNDNLATSFTISSRLLDSG